jgi:hypothetical protein
MIAHASLPAVDCAKVARVLAQMMGGGALRFPPGGPDAWNCWSRGNDFQVVVTPCGQVMVEGPREQVWVRREPPHSEDRAYESHFAIAVERSSVDIVGIARTAGWHARVCNRGGLFELVEVWVENAYLVEVLDPAQMADYRRAMTVENWKRVFGLSESGAEQS